MNLMTTERNAAPNHRLKDKASLVTSTTHEMGLDVARAIAASGPFHHRNDNFSGRRLDGTLTAQRVSRWVVPIRRGKTTTALMNPKSICDSTFSAARRPESMLYSGP
jgi:hypothetical protein